MLHIKDIFSYFIADGELKVISAPPILGLWSKWNSSQKAQGSWPWKTRSWEGWVFLVPACLGYHGISMIQRNIDKYFSGKICVHEVCKIWTARWFSGWKYLNQPSWPEFNPCNLYGVSPHETRLVLKPPKADHCMRLPSCTHMRTHIQAHTK